MEAIIIKDIPFNIQADRVYPLLKIKSGTRLEGRFDECFKQALKIARPKVAYKLCAVEHQDDNLVLLDGIIFQSRILKVNLQNCQRAFAFIATCGMELDAWAQTLDNTMEAFWADTINMLALGVAVETFKNHVQKTFQTGTTSTMNPGSLADWPLGQQHNLFALMGDAASAIGVTLNQNAMMKPVKSVSGIEFESGEKFYNCQLCPRDKCPGRRARYDEYLFAAKYK